jgi:spermidine synthase
VIGLGGACVQRYLHNLLPAAVIETAELDPAVADVARRFFSLKEDARQKVHIGDGRKFVEQSKDKYDIIMLDAFSADSVPYLLATREFLKVCQDHLADGGIVCANLWHEEVDYGDMLRTYAAVFPEWHILYCDDATNAILVAFPARRDLTAARWMELARAFDKAHPTGLDLTGLIDQAIDPSAEIPPGAKVLLDADAGKRK